MFQSGNIVSWSNHLWIVSGVTTIGGRVAGMQLLSTTSPAHTAHPSTEWPQDKIIEDEDTGEITIINGQRVDTVKYVARSMQDYIKMKLNGIFPELKI